MSIERARAVADAVLYEGYVLYPYRASARKNQVRWQFGVLVPPAGRVLEPSERTSAEPTVVAMAWISQFPRAQPSQSSGWSER